MQRLKFTVCPAEVGKKFKNIRTACGRCLKKKEAVPLGLQRYTSVPVHRNIFCHDISIVYWTISYRDIYDTFSYASTNMGKHCLQLVLALFPLFSPYARRFAEQTGKKNPCWAVFVESAILNIMLNACMLQLGFVSCTDFWAHKQDMRRLFYIHTYIHTYISFI